MADDLDKIIADAVAEAEAQEKVNEARKEGAEAAQEQADAVDALTTANRVSRQQLEEINSALREQFGHYENSNEATDKYRANVQSLVSAQTAMVQAVAEGNEPLQNQLQGIIDSNEEWLANKANLDGVEDGAQKVGVALIENNKRLSEQNQKLKNAEFKLRQYSDETFKAGLIIKTFSSILSTAQAGALDFSAGGFAMAKQLTEMGLKFDTASKAVEINTGLGAESSAMMRDLVLDNSDLAVSNEEARKAMGALNLGYSGFIGQNQAMKNSLGDTVLALERLGVASETSAKALDILDRGMGMGAEGAQAALEDFDKLGQKLGLPTTKVAEDFTKLGPKLARFGKDGKKQFDLLSEQARSLGLDVSAAFDIAEAFDTFEGAADLAGKLNAQLGLQINSVEMMKLKHEDRIKLLRQEFAASGQNFDQMDHRQQQAIAEMMGMEVDMVAKLFGDPVAYEQAAKDQEEARERAARLTDVQKKLAVMGDKLMIAFGPVLKGFAFLAELLTMGPIPYFIAGITGIIGVFKTLLMVQKAVFAVQGVLTAGQKAYTLAVAAGNVKNAAAIGFEKVKSFFRAKEIAETPAVLAAKGAVAGADAAQVPPKAAATKATVVQTAATTAAIGPTLAFAAAVLAIGLSIAAAAWGMAHFIRAFGDLDIPQLIAAGLGFVGMSAGIWALVGSLPALAATSIATAKPLYILAGAMLGIGGAIALAAGGMSIFLEQLANVDPSQLLSFGAAFLSISYGVNLMALSVILLAKSLVTLATTAGLTTPILWAIGGALMLIGAGIALIGAGANLALEGVTDVIEVSAKITPSGIEGVTKLMDKMIDVQVAGQFANVPALNAIAGAVSPTAGAGGAAAKQGNKKTVELKVNERILGDVVVDIMNDRYDLTPR